MESIVALTVDDAGEVLTLQRAAYVTEAQIHDDPHLPPLTQSLAELVDELKQPAVTGSGLRDTGGRLVAAVRVRVASDDPRVAEIRRLVVAPDMQGRGLGSRLLHLVEDRLPSQVGTLRLFTGERSVGNLRLYSRFGYRETHRTPTPGGYALVHLAKEVARTSKPVG